jgi:protein gp37
VGARAARTAAGARRRICYVSLADIFDAEVSDDWRDELFACVMMATPHLDGLPLTKWPQGAKKWVDEQGLPDNVWLGTTVENQAMTDLRIPILLSTPAKVRFLSYEPWLERVTLRIQWLANLGWIIVGGEKPARSQHGRGTRHARPAPHRWRRLLREADGVQGRDPGRG